DGTIYQLVADAHRAWQAGAGAWGTINELNSASIGIELDNDGETPFEPALIDSLIRLLDDLCTRLDIPRDAIIAHADLAPARKRDPGFRFPWKQLSDAGFGRWPRGELVDPPQGFDPWMALRVLGYPLHIDKSPGYKDTVRAFHRHYRGDENDVLDAEDARILYALTRLPDANADGGAAAPRKDDAAGLPYLVFETRGAAPDAELPMIVGLHYSGGSPEAMVAYFDGIQVPVRVVLPQGPHTRPGGHSWFARDYSSLAASAQAEAAIPMAETLAAFVLAVQARHPTRGKPVAMGVSYGGDLALLLALRHPDRVAAAFPVAARALPEWLPGSNNCTPGCPPIRAMHGAADATVAAAPTAARIEQLARMDFDASIATYPGVGHSFGASMQRDFARAVEALVGTPP